MSHRRGLRRLGGMNTTHSLAADPHPASSGAPSTPIASATAPTWRRRLHRAGGCLLALYATAHLGNHLVALAGVAAHQHAMEALRLFYRHPLVEPLLLLIVLTQVASGARGAWQALHGGRPMHPVAHAQALSGLVLGSFVLIHTCAVLAGRWVLQLDTNFYFAAAGMHVPPYGWFFVPYYFAGVAALGMHLGCAAYWALSARPTVWRRRVALALALLGVGLGALLCLLLAGAIVPVHVPAAYRANYGM